MTYEPPITTKIAEYLDNQIVGEVLKIGIDTRQRRANKSPQV